MRKKRHIPAYGRGALDYQARPAGHLIDGFSSRNSHGPQRPVGHFTANIGSRPAFVLAIIPLAKVGLDLRNVAVAGDPARVHRASERTRERQRKPPSREI